MGWVIRRKFPALISLGVLLLAGCARPPSLPRKAPEVKAGELPKITVIAGGTQSYWLEAKRGAEAAGKKFGAKILWKSPAASDPVAMQTALVETAARTSHGVVLAPIDSTQLLKAVGNAARAGMAVVVFNRDVFSVQNKLSFVHGGEEGNQSGYAPDYYQMAYQSVKAILDYRALKDVPREIKIAPRLITKCINKSSPQRRRDAKNNNKNSLRLRASAVQKRTSQ